MRNVINEVDYSVEAIVVEGKVQHRQAWKLLYNMVDEVVVCEIQDAQVVVCEIQDAQHLFLPRTPNNCRLMLALHAWNSIAR